MINLTEEQAAEMDRLSKIAEEKGAEFKRIDKELGETNGFADINSVPEYIKAKAELDAALRELNIYKASLGTF